MCSELAYGVFTQNCDSSFLWKWRNKNGYDVSDNSKWPDFPYDENTVVGKHNLDGRFVPLDVFSTRQQAILRKEELESMGNYRPAIQRYFIRVCKRDDFRIHVTRRYKDHKTGKLIEVN